MSSFLRRLFSGISSVPEVNMSAAKTKVEGLINDNAVMVFSKSYCPYCKSTKKLLEGLGVKPTYYELNEESDGSALQDALEEISGQRSVPNTYIAKEHIGGNDKIQSIPKETLKQKLQAAGALA